MAKAQDALEVKDLNVFYKSEQVLYDINFKIRKGETLGLVGLSGCGKSTLARTILNMVKAKKGEILLEEKSPMMVFQDPFSALNKVKKVGWLLEEPLRNGSRLSKEERKEKVMNMLLDIGLKNEYYDRYPDELSGGERQRVCIGMALIGGSKFVILDEPTSSLDVTVQNKILDLLDDLKKRHDLTYLFISHDMNVIYRVCDRVMVMNQGRIIELGEMKEVFSNPKEEFTKELLKASFLEE